MQSLFARCVQIDGNLDLGSAPGCAAFAGLDYAPMARCMQNATALQQLRVQNAKKTLSLGVGKLGVPWVLVGGVVLQDTTQFLTTVCGAWNGTKPAGCN